MAPQAIFNSLAPGSLMIDGWSKIVLKLMPMDLTDGKSTLVQVMAWCNVDLDLWRHMASLGPNELNKSP